MIIKMLKSLRVQLHQLRTNVSGATGKRERSTVAAESYSPWTHIWWM